MKNGALPPVAPSRICPLELAAVVDTTPVGLESMTPPVSELSIVVPVELIPPPLTTRPPVEAMSPLPAVIVPVRERLELTSILRLFAPGVKVIVPAFEVSVPNFGAAPVAPRST